MQTLTLSTSTSTAAFASRRTVSGAALRDAHTRAAPSMAPRTPQGWTRYWLERLDHALALRESSPTLCGQYASILRDFLQHHPGNPSRIGPAEIGRYLLNCRQARGQAATDAHAILAALNFFYHHVIQAPHCLAGIPRPGLDEDRKLPTLLNAEKIRAQIETCSNGKHRLALSLAYGCGLRVSELAQLQWMDVDLDKQSLRLRAGKGRKDRTVALPAALVGQMHAYRKQFQPIRFVFESHMAGRPMHPRTFQAILEEACEKAGMGRRSGAYASRESYALHLLETGADLRFVQALLGQGDVRPEEGYGRVTAANAAA